MTEFIVVSGAGGVGKTTSSAALALAIAHTGRRTLLVTVDPARRLADVVEQPLGDDIVVHDSVATLSLWMPSASTELTRIAKETMSVEEHQAFEANRVTELFHAAPAGLHEAACSLSLGQVAEAYDVVVVDTAPSEQSTSFLEAPTRLRHLLDGNALALFSAFGSGRGLGQRLVERMLDRVMPAEVIAEGAEFFRSILSVRTELARRAARAETLLAGARHVVVASPSEAGTQSALMIRRALETRGARSRRLGQAPKIVMTLLNQATGEGNDAKATKRALRHLSGAHTLPLVEGSSRHIVNALSRELVEPAASLLSASPRAHTGARASSAYSST